MSIFLFMAKKKSEKAQIITELTQKFKTMKSAVFTSFFGLKMSDLDTLRKECRNNQSEHMVVKKTLLGRAVKESGAATVDVKTFTGEVAATFGYGDEVTPAKVVAAFAKTHPNVKFLGGILEGKFIDAKAVAYLATIPGREALLGQMVGSLNAPVSGFVNVLAGNLRGLVNVLKAVSEKK